MGSSMAENHPVGFQWVIEAREKRRDGHPRRPALHAHVGDGRSSGCRCAPAATSSSSARLVNYVLAQRPRVPRVRRRLHERRRRSSSTTSATPRISTACSRAGTTRTYDRDWRTTATTRQSRPYATSGRGRGATPTSIRSATRRSASALRLPDPDAPLRALHAGDGRAVCGMPRGRVPARSPTRSAARPARSAPARSATRSAGRSTRPACRSSAPPRSCSCCSATSAGPAAASSRCAATRRSRARPTSRRSTTSCPATCRCRRSARDRARSTATSRKHRSNAGWWAQLRHVHRLAAEGVVRRRGDRENDFGFGWLPRITGDHSHFGYWLDMADGDRRSARRAVRHGTEPGGRRAERAARAPRAGEAASGSSCATWSRPRPRRSGSIRRKSSAASCAPRTSPPRCSSSRRRHAEKDGCFTNTQRLLQWHEKAVDPPGDARSEAWFVYHLGRRLKARAARDRSPRNAGLRALTWDYPTAGPHGEPDIDAVLREINGARRSTARRSSTASAASPPTASTACGCWIYSGVYPTADATARASAARPARTATAGASPGRPTAASSTTARRRDPTARRGASARSWSGGTTRRERGPASTRRTSRATSRRTTCRRRAPRATPRSRGDAPFIMHPDGARLALGADRPEGRSAAGALRAARVAGRATRCIASRRIRPRIAKSAPDNPYAQSPGDPRYPHVLTTYRLTEHHTAGGMSRTLSHLAELQPELFCEISPELAREVGVANGDMGRDRPRRAATIEARALVTPRIRPLDDQRPHVHQVGLPVSLRRPRPRHAATSSTISSRSPRSRT